MKKHIYVFGNIGKMSELPKSGGQSSARRVMKGLEDEGFIVHPIVRHRAEWPGKVAHQAEVMLYAVIDLMKIMQKLIFASRKDSQFFHLTFSGTLVPYEYIISKMVSLLGFKTSTYLQGGQFMDAFINGSKLHRELFRRNANMQEVIMFEGKEAMDIVRPITNTPLVYFPGYAFDKDIPSDITKRPSDRINICYFGRIGKGKNVKVTIETFEELCKTHDNVYLTIVGGPGGDKKYVAEVDAMIEQSPYANHITRKGLSPLSYLIEMMQAQHFYLFPTEERCEGHPNALTECMSQGVIPIVSDYHFNRSIVADDRLVVKGYDPQSYADCISKLVETADLTQLSVKMRDHVTNDFCYSKINPMICEVLKII